MHIKGLSHLKNSEKNLSLTKTILTWFLSGKSVIRLNIKLVNYKT